jgi:hypothetical protein
MKSVAGALAHAAQPSRAVDVVTDVRRLSVRATDGSALRRAAAAVEREWLLVVLGLFVVAGNVLACRWWLSSDGWFSVLYGREIVHHGLPHHDTLTLLGAGRDWVDQQWLAHVALYGLMALGGPKLTTVATAFLFSLAFLLTVLLARRRGARAGAVVAIAIPAWLYASTFVQAEVFSRLFFLGLLALLAAESRRRTRRVWLVLPLLALWANVHGAVVLGAGLVALLGAIELWQVRAGRSPGRAAAWRALALLVTPWACLVATPYGLSGLQYYRATIFSSSFHTYVGPWMPPIPFSIVGGPFFVLALLAAGIVARSHSRLTAFELGTLALTLLAAVETRRSIAWFAMACVLFLPAALRRDDERHARASHVRLHLAAVAAAAVLALAASVQAAAQPQSYFTPGFSDRAAAFVGRYAKAHPQARIWVNDPLGDWLVYRQPELWGRIGYDARWENLTPKQVEVLHTFLYRGGPSWKAQLRGYDLLVLSRNEYAWIRRPLERDPAFRTVYRDADSVVRERAGLTR